MFVTQFENEERQFRNRKTAIAVTVTVAVHALLLLYLIFSILHTPDPPYEDNAGGMSVNFGTDLTGSGSEQPFTYNPGTVASSAPAEQAKATPQESSPEDVIAQENADNNVVVPKADEKPKHKVNKEAILKPKPKNAHADAPVAKAAPVVNNTPPEPKADPHAMFQKGAYGKPNNSKGDGTGGAQGDQGKPTGDPNSTNYLGGDGDGTGTGPGHGDLKGGFSLKGRKKMDLPPPNKCSSQGRVVMAIKVNRSGKVTEATFKRFESTVFDDCNKSTAHDAAMKATFNVDANAPEIQEGTITYIYKVN